MSSFRGNIGDVLSNFGLKILLRKLFKSNFSLKQLELRNTFKNYTGNKKIIFNKTFAESLNNEFDYFFIGGGSMLEPFEMIGNGIRLPINDTFLDALKIPIIFTSVGAAPRSSKGFSEKSDLVERICNNRNYFKGFRIDGSFPWINKTYRDSLQNCFEVVDNAFLAQIDYFKELNPKKEKYFILNLAFDQFKELNKESYPIYLNNIVNLIDFICYETGLFVYLVPHTPQDIYMAADIFKKSKETLIRKFLNVSELNSGEEGLESYISLYKNAEFCFATRFHSTILAALTNTPIISVGVLERIKYMINASKIKCIELDLYKNLKSQNEIQQTAEKILRSVKDRHEFNKDFTNICSESINLYKRFFLS